MTQYSSREPFTNNDPAPHVHYLTGRRTLFTSASSKSILNYDFDPRPEFDRPQTNPTNPILVNYRACRDGALPYARPEVWAHNLLHPQHEAWYYATPEQIKHARRVLTRLANLKEES